MDKKRVTIEISNQELNALEDFLVSNLTLEKKEQYRLICIELWEKLVKEYNKETNEIESIVLEFPYSFCIIHVKTRTFICSYRKNNISLQSYLKALTMPYKHINTFEVLSKKIYEEFDYMSDYEMYEKYFKNNPEIFGDSPSIS